MLLHIHRKLLMFCSCSEFYKAWQRTIFLRRGRLIFNEQCGGRITRDREVHRLESNHSPWGGFKGTEWPHLYACLYAIPHQGL